MDLEKEIVKGERESREKRKIRGERDLGLRESDRAKRERKC